MGVWNFYFFAKLGLYFSELIGFHWLENLVFALFLLIPWRGRWVLLKNAAGVQVGMVLLYYDSWLPPFQRLIAQAGNLATFSSDYVLELLTLYANGAILGVGLVVFILFQWLRTRIRFSTFAVLGILAVPAIGPFGSAASVVAQAAEQKTAQVDSAAILNRFYEEESGRRIQFDLGGKRPEFDVLLLHICSLAWDDMAYVNETGDSLFNRFDILFKNFNSATSYSGPAAIRLLRANCGQQKHKDIYDPVEDSCYLFGNLAALGYDVQAILNHDGHFDGFRSQIESVGGVRMKLLDNRFADVAMHSFDGTPIRSDLAVLSGWLQQRDAAGAHPTALYYNSISLHDGNEVPGMKSRLSRDTYQPRLGKMLADLSRFIEVLEARGKPVVLILVAEHGASLRGDKSQISGMREIPSPRITIVPAAVKLIDGRNRAGQTPLMVDKPTSYLALSGLLAEWFSTNPFGGGRHGLQEIVERLPETRLVSENSGIVVMETNKGFETKSEDGPWVPLGL